jgi:hypothetical protein
VGAYDTSQLSLPVVLNAAARCASRGPYTPHITCQWEMEIQDIDIPESFPLASLAKAIVLLARRSAAKERFVPWS